MTGYIKPPPLMPGAEVVKPPQPPMYEEEEEEEEEDPVHPSLKDWNCLGTSSHRPFGTPTVSIEVIFCQNPLIHCIDVAQHAFSLLHYTFSPCFIPPNFICFSVIPYMLHNLHSVVAV
jgi:hypothetical protein